MGHAEAPVQTVPAFRRDRVGNPDPREEVFAGQAVNLLLNPQCAGYATAAPNSYLPRPAS